jgi:hypothetical protein
MTRERTLDERKLDMLRVEFYARIMNKTRWDRDTVMQAFDAAMQAAERRAIGERITK